MHNSVHFNLCPKGAAKKTLQKFIFSATLTLPKSFKKRGKEKTITKGETLGNSIV